MRRILLTAFAFSAFAGVAAAAMPVTDGEAVLQKKIAIEAARMASPVGPALNYLRSAPTRVPGIAQTSITTRFAGRDDAATDAGLLCGLMPHADTGGAAGAFGRDPDGKFVGAKLRLSF